MTQRSSINTPGQRLSPHRFFHTQKARPIRAFCFPRISVTYFFFGLLGWLLCRSLLRVFSLQRSSSLEPSLTLFWPMTFLFDFLPGFFLPPFLPPCAGRPFFLCRRFFTVFFATFLSRIFFAAAFLAGAFLATAFLAAAFFAGAFFATAFLAAAFLAGPSSQAPFLALPSLWELTSGWVRQRNRQPPVPRV